MERLLINLRSEQRLCLGELSKQTGAPMAELIRRAIDQYLNGWEASHKGESHGSDNET